MSYVLQSSWRGVVGGINFRRGPDVYAYGNMEQSNWSLWPAPGARQGKRFGSAIERSRRDLDGPELLEQEEERPHRGTKSMRLITKLVLGEKWKHDRGSTFGGFGRKSRYGRGDQGGMRVRLLSREAPNGRWGTLTA